MEIDATELFDSINSNDDLLEETTKQIIKKKYNQIDRCHIFA
jgi:hypothetical protein